VRRHLFVILSIFLLLSGCANWGVVDKTRMLMGTQVQIIVSGSGFTRVAKTAAIDKAFERIKEIEGLLSVYDATSEISKVNSFADVRPITVSDDTIRVIKKADEISKITGGAFDITIAPLVNLWGFGPRGVILNKPKEREIHNALRLVGMRNIKIDYARKTIRFLRSGVRLDLSGIAKGYAVDCAIETLKSEGIKNAMVNAGGDIYCIGKVSPCRQWRIGIQNPRHKNEIIDTVDIEDSAIATSGDYERFSFYSGVRVSHIIDPRTGEPKSSVPASVSIKAADCMTADAFATAVFVLGPDKGLDFLSKVASVEGMIIIEKKDRFEAYRTDGFKKK